MNKFDKIWKLSEEAAPGARTISKRIQKLIQNMLENQ